MIVSLDPFINFISNGAILIVISLLLYLVGKYINQNLHKIGSSLLISLISSGILTQALKHIIGRARPRITHDLVFIGPSFKSGYDSFPSGHSTSVFCCAFILSEYFPKYKGLFYIFAVLVALERVEDLSHFPSDVVAGTFIGIMTAKIILTKTFRSEQTQKDMVMEQSISYQKISKG
jgi:undecaprenyl-diphosphatase